MLNHANWSNVWDSFEKVNVYKVKCKLTWLLYLSATLT